MVDRGLNDKRPCETERGAALADDPDRCVATDLDGNGSKHADTAIGREIADARRQPEEVLVAGTTLPKLRIDAARPAEDIGEIGLTVAQLLFERDPVRGQRGVVNSFAPGALDAGSPCAMGIVGAQHEPTGESADGREQREDDHVGP